MQIIEGEGSPKNGRKERIPEEIEFKILNIDTESVLRDLEEFNAKKTFDGIIEDFYFDSEDNIVREAGCRLRVRHTTEKDKETGKEVSKFTVVYKGKKSKTSSGYSKRPETNGLTVGTFSEAVLTVKALIKQEIDRNFAGEVKPVFHFKKHRISYEIDQINVDIDNYIEISGIKLNGAVPPLLELETFEEKRLSDMEDLARELGLEIDEKHRHYSTNDVLKHYGIKLSSVI